MSTQAADAFDKTMQKAGKAAWQLRTAFIAAAVIVGAGTAFGPPGAFITAAIFLTLWMR